MLDVRRREFITLLGGAAAAWPVTVIGFLGSQSAETVADYLRAFRQGIKDAGYVEGETIAVEYRWAEGQVDRLPDLVTDLNRQGKKSSLSF
jgi:basic membrane lipoprotein Med (substrate-binding protein (PBP1-ABC) superfamily)